MSGSGAGAGLRGADRSVPPAPAGTGRDGLLEQLGIGAGGGLHPRRFAATLAVAAAAVLLLAAPGPVSGSLAGVHLVLAVLLRRYAVGRRTDLAVPVLLAADPAAVALLDRPAAALLVLPALAAAYLGLCARPGDTLRALPLLLAGTALGGASAAGVAGQLVLALVVGEVTARARRGAQRLLHEARRSAETDPLTGLGNRRRLDDALTRLPEGGVLVVVDLDHFKRYNDRWGHPAGDALLVRFAGILRSVLGSADEACRFGGEEFVVVLPDPAVAGTLFVRLRAAWEATAPTVTFSAGLAVRRPGEQAPDALARADAALYEAKDGGRDRAVGPLLVPRQRAGAARPVGG